MEYMSDPYAEQEQVRLRRQAEVREHRLNQATSKTKSGDSGKIQVPSQPSPAIDLPDEVGKADPISTEPTAIEQAEQAAVEADDVVVEDSLPDEVAKADPVSDEPTPVEKAGGETTVVEGDEAETSEKVEKPARSDVKAQWLAYAAQESGESVESLDEKNTKDELVEKYG